ECEGAGGGHRCLLRRSGCVHQSTSGDAPSVGDGKLGGVSAFGSTLVVSGTEQLLASRLVDERRSAALAEHPGADVNRLEAVELEGSMLAEVVGGSLFSSDIVAIIDDVGATPPDVVDQLVATAVDPGPD